MLCVGYGEIIVRSDVPSADLASIQMHVTGIAYDDNRQTRNYCNFKKRREFKMSQNNIGQTKQVSKAKWIIGFSLLASGFLLLILSLPDYISGTTDTYQNQNARLVTNSFTQVFLISAVLFNYHSKEPLDRSDIIYKILLFIAAITLVISLLLSI
jgi:hypothetical protein